MPKPENVKPHEFKPGQSGNPAGRPPGSRSLATVLREMLEEEITVRIEGQPDQKRPFKEVIIRRLLKAANDGDVRAIQAIFDRVDGKAKEFIELAMPGGLATTSEATHEIIFRDFSKPERKPRAKKKRATKPPKQ